MSRLYKYSLNSALKELPISIPEYVIKLTKNGNDPTFHPCSFLATDGSMDTYQAHDYLALTYYPLVCYETNLLQSGITFEDNRGIKLDSIESGFSPPSQRTWPSFGQPGGAREVILVEDSCEFNANLTLLRTFSDGGEIDEFHQDNTANYDPDLSKLIARGLISALDESEINVRDNGTTIGKVIPESGTTINFRKGLDHRFISLSSGYSNHCCFMEIKLWATLWEDDMNSNERCIYGPLEKNVSFPLPSMCLPCSHLTPADKEKIINLLGQSSCFSAEIKNLVRDLMKRLSGVTDDFFRKYALRYRLPS